MKPTLPALILILSTAAALAGGHMGEGVEHFFENWDLDSDGTISLAEATEQREGLFYMFDSDENGVLDTVEYDLFDETRASASETENMPSKAMQAIDTLKREFNDTDQDGQVSREEFLTGTDTWLQALDRNKDGAVSQADFGQS
ncbi:EF-hand domain-containing protein [uncultured Ruegeria sp.]|uniref:EF-hand domain-containing protein n=1 Tax=uncultured Ruegeria sp. TaxID=259304 RepID=UPI0026175A0F|nr:EF-hand domain-containing protein [uncultured Ruegeria sp.]